jgi:hypothetical protein
MWPVSKAVPEVYRGGKFGVEAVVTMAGVDAAVLTELLQFAAMLHAMASRTGQLAGHSDHTRKIIREMRNLATEIQEEVETRRGPT